MKKVKFARSLIGLFLISQLGGGVAFSEPKIIELNEDNFSFGSNTEYEFRQMHDRDALCMNGTALLNGISLREGVVSVDVANTGTRHFANILFHADDHENAEAAYLRMHKSGYPDAVQYTPHFNGESNWQLMGQSQIVADFGNGPWVNLQVAFNDSGAVITVGAAKSQLHVSSLRLRGEGAGVGLETLFEGCFSNLSVAPAPVEIAATEPASDPGSGIISSWSLSEVLRFDALPDNLDSAESIAGWTEAEADPDGTLFVSRYRRKLSGGEFEQNERDLVYAGVSLKSDIAQSVDFAFDLSDLGAIYLNGQRLFQVDNSFRAKGALFRGDFDRSKQILSLPLRQGQNDLVVAVAERANGWGLSGQLIQADGIAVELLQPAP